MTAETLRSWVRQVEVDIGKRPGTTNAEAERIKELERDPRPSAESTPREAIAFNGGGRSLYVQKA